MIKGLQTSEGSQVVVLNYTDRQGNTSVAQHADSPRDYGTV